MRVSEYIEKLTALAKEKGLYNAEITSVGSGQGTIEGEDPRRVYHYYVVFTDGKPLGEQLRVYWDYDPDIMTMDQLLSFDYMRYAYTDDEVVLEAVLKSIPKETQITFKDSLNDKEYDVPYEDRVYMIRRFGDRTVTAVTGNNEAVVVSV